MSAPRLVPNRFARALALLATAVQLSAAGVSHAAPPDLADNTWAYLNPALTWRYIPVAGDPGATQQYVQTREPCFREFSSPVYGDGKIFYFGGAHSGYPGNDVEIYDINANTWTQSYKPEVPPAGDPMYGSGGSPNISPTGKPYTIHGYARTTYNPVLHRYVCTNASSIASYDPVANAWQWIAGVRAPNGQPAMPPIGSGEQLTQWDPIRNGHLLTAMYDWNGVWAFANGGFTGLGNNGTRMSVSGGAASVYIPDLQAHLFAVLPTANNPPTGHLYLYYPANNTTVEIQSVPSSLRSQFSPEGNFVMAYDSNTRKVVCLTPVDKNASGRTTRIQVWVYSPAADTWEALPIATTSPLVAAWNPGSGRSIFHYDPISNLFFLVIPKDGIWRNGVETWAFRYRRSTVSNDAIPPSSVTDFRSSP